METLRQQYISLKSTNPNHGSNMQGLLIFPLSQGQISNKSHADRCGFKISPKIGNLIEKKRLTTKAFQDGGVFGALKVEVAPCNFFIQWVGFNGVFIHQLFVVYHDNF